MVGVVYNNMERRASEPRNVAPQRRGCHAARMRLTRRGKINGGVGERYLRDPPVPVLSTFLRGVLEAGRLVLREPLPPTADPDAHAALADAYRLHALSVAGPPVAFDGATALAAGRVLYNAGWCLLNGNEPVDVTRLQMPGDPRTPSHHLSADLVFRYLPAVHRRARALRPDDELAAALAKLLRRWPLSGVLADVDDGPLTATDFAGHAGLCLLYAERLARHERAGWFPTGGTIEAVELVWHDLGRDASTLPAAQQVASELVRDE
jgi:hypothetical protein